MTKTPEVSTGSGSHRVVVCKIDDQDCHRVACAPGAELIREDPTDWSATVSVAWMASADACAPVNNAAPFGGMTGIPSL